MEQGNHIRRTADDDRATESAILQHLLALHPTAVTLEELARELGGGDDSPAQRDAAERAVRDLAAAGLLHRAGPVLLPSRAALRFDQLLGE